MAGIRRNLLLALRLCAVHIREELQHFLSQHAAAKGDLVAGIGGEFGDANLPLPQQSTEVASRSAEATAAVADRRRPRSSPGRLRMHTCCRARSCKR